MIACGCIDRRSSGDEPRVPLGGVVHHCVEHHAHPASAERFQETPERVVATQVRIDVLEVDGVVPVRARRGEDRVEVERRHAEILEVGEGLAHAVEVATEEFASAHTARR